MKTTLPVFNYSEEFTFNSALGHLMENPDPSGLCLTSVGGCMVPIPNDQLVCDKVFNTLLILPKTGYAEFVGFTGFYMTMMADIIRKVANAPKVSSDGIRLLCGEDIIGLSSSRVVDGIGMHYIPVFMKRPSLKSGAEPMHLSCVEMSDETVAKMHETIETQFRELLRQLFQQELAMRITSSGSK